MVTNMRILYLKNIEITLSTTTIENNERI